MSKESGYLICLSSRLRVVSWDKWWRGDVSVCVSVCTRMSVRACVRALFQFILEYLS